MNGGQAMEQLDKAATVIVHHQPRQRSFAGAGRFVTEIIAHIWRCAQFETHIYGSDFSMRLPLVSASLTLPQHKGKHNV
jgi:hypothetical protein